jgi:hypothetical protein
MPSSAIDWEDAAVALKNQAQAMGLEIRVGLMDSEEYRVRRQEGLTTIGGQACWSLGNVIRLWICPFDASWEELALMLAHEIGHWEQVHQGFYRFAYHPGTRVDVECDAWHRALRRFGDNGWEVSPAMRRKAQDCLMTYVKADGWTPYAGDTLEMLEEV